MSYDFYKTHEEMRKLWPLGKKFGLKAIQLSQDWSEKKIPDTPSEFQGFLYYRLLDTLRRMLAPSDVIDRQLDAFRKITVNPASAILIDLMRATESEFFVQWLQDSMAVSSFAMEPAYRYGRDILGVYRKMPDYDPAVAMSDDAGYSFTRWRDKKASELMQATGKEGKVLSIACGTLPELRFFDYPVDLLLSQEFICYDYAKIDLEMFFKANNMPTKTVHMEQLDLSSALKKEIPRANKMKYDLINIKGYLSYALPQLSEIIPAVVSILKKPGAKFAFDLQLANWTMLRNKWIFLWGQGEGIQFELLDNAEAAKELVEKIIKDAKLPVKVAVEVAPEDLDASGIFVTLTKK
ncbi:hypothetical protein IKG16_00580 [Candidatus Saccharibacteria bacterium]|nr:hypothetical protein [Candidatus Saccharibacteria bacterium]